MFLLMMTACVAKATDGRVDLQRRLERLYEGKALPRTVFEGVEGRASACIVLGHVVAHMSDVGRTVNSRNLTMLSWALQLMRFDSSPDDRPFVRALIRKRLFALVDRYESTPRFDEIVVQLMDTARAWVPQHLTFLAKRAGRGSVEERIWNVERALATSPWPDAEVRRMLKTLRAIPVGRRSAEQWGLIGLSGRATTNELVHILTMGAKSFASADPDSRLLDGDHSIRQAIDALVDRFDEDDPQALRVVERATELSEAETDHGSLQRIERDRFFEAVHNDIEIVTPAPPSPPKPAPPKRVKFRSRYRRVGNVYYPFAKRCDQALESGAPGG